MRAALAQDISENATAWRYAIMRQVSIILRDYKTSDIADNEDAIINAVMRQFNIPASARSEMASALQDYQSASADLWDRYFDEAGIDVSLSSSDLDRIMSAYQVDFAKIKIETRNIIIDEIQKTARVNKGYDDLRSRLMARGLGYGQAATLANTGLAQFDNAYMQTMARQAGIDKYLYDGVLHPTSRIFCQDHIGRIYSTAEIMEMDNGQGLPVMTSCGGYNCAHYWTPSFDGE